MIPATETPVCEAAGVRVVRAGRALLDDVSIALHAGELLAVLGPNGAGKSTLLGALTGDLSPDAGDVRFAGRPLKDWGLGELSRRRGVLLQDTATSFPFTVREVVEMGRAPWRRTARAAEDEEAVDAAIAAADIAHLSGRRVPSLSGGERARTAFARVVAGRTGALFLDEPTAALDLGHQEDLLRLARDRARAGDAVLIILHDLNLAAAYADRVILLQNGRIVAAGGPDEAFTAETLSAVYRTPVEVIPHPVTGRGIVLPLRG
ncbi:heme ABC transporter ATP-binding protein [Microbacterium sp.]|uniref:heme ABC transporter ATP-binding protein n=1 Tax=Microbacterium sp. TaxID=51671 RepID=UPI00333EA3C6